MNEKLKQEVFKAAEILDKGGIILYPTDTIWGIGCKANDDKAIQRIIELKKRPKTKSLIALVGNEAMLQRHVEVPELAWDLIDLSEKPTTIVYEKPSGVSNLLLAEDGSLGIRLTKNEFCKRLTEKIKTPLVSTSANISGENTALTFDSIGQEIKNNVDYIVNLDQDKTSKFSGSAVIKLNLNGEVKVLRA